MRISTSMIYSQAAQSIDTQQASIMNIGQQIAAGKSVLYPSNNPGAAAESVRVGEAQATTTQYTNARVTARNTLSQESSALQNVTNALTSARTSLVQAANGTLDATDLQGIASDLSSIYQSVLSQANAQDGEGHYLFGGYDSLTPPFVAAAPGAVATYVGDSSVQQQRVSASETMDVTNNGASVFNGQTGPQGFVAMVGGANTGTETAGSPQVVNTGAANYGDGFKIQFSIPGTGPATYTITDSTTGVTSTAQPYVAGGAIQYGGVSLAVSGQPAHGDTITVGSATGVFQTLQDAITALQQPVNTPAQQAALRNAVGNAMNALDANMDNMSSVSASVGARLDQLQSLDDTASTAQTSYAQTQSALVDLDYATAISKYDQQQVGLQAAQQVFVKMQQSNLFDMLQG